MLSTFRVVCSDILFVNVYVSTTTYITPSSHDDDVIKCIQNIVKKIKHGSIQANLTTILQSTMFESGKFECNDLLYLNNGYIFIFKVQHP